MTQVAKLIRGKRKEANGPPFEACATIFLPQPTEGHDEFVCVVRCPALFAADKQIAGVDAQQAIELAEMLVRQLLEHHGFVPVDAEQ